MLALIVYEDRGKLCNILFCTDVLIFPHSCNSTLQICFAVREIFFVFLFCFENDEYVNIDFTVKLLDLFIIIL